MEDCRDAPQAEIPTVDSTVSSKSGTFDPNSFLFLSPLSDHDVDDPDYGMPLLLSRSNSHNAVVMDCISTPAGPPPGPPTNRKWKSSRSPTISNSKSLLIRLPPSPRVPASPKILPPSGKKNLKRTKICDVGGGGVIVRHGSGLNTSRPPLLQHRAQSSTF